MDVEPTAASTAAQFATDGSHDGKPRLCIQKLVLENFKSYAGVQNIGPFHKSFSSIVGPNGSGKSNVIDALLFVFGKRAKQIRLNKVSELIHNSDEHQNLESAKVEVHFVDVIDGENGEAIHVAGSEMVVGRVAMRNNSSKYYVNGKGASRSDVEELLASKGIDLENNRFLILQGEVEQIAMMKPKGQTEHETGFLEYLEDVIGSNRHVELIAERGGAVEALNEDRSLKLNRVKAVEGERENLEGAKTEAEDFLRKELQLSQKQKVSFMLSRADCVAARGVVEGQQAEAQAKLGEQQKVLAETMANLENFESGYTAKTAEYEQIAQELATSKSEFAAYERKDVKYREDLKHAKEKEKKLKDSVKKETAKITKETKALATFESAAEEHEEKVKELTVATQKEEAALEEIYSVVKGETEALRNALEAKKKEAAPFRAQAEDCRSQVDLLGSEIELLRSKAEAGAKQLAELEASIAAIDTKLSLRQEDLGRYAKKTGSLHEEKASATAELEALKDEEQSTSAQLKELRSTVQESRAASDEQKRHGGALQALMSAKQDSLPGIEDRLGNLGTIDSKYDVAISTACSGTLGNIVVGDTDTAQRCVGYLKKHNLGRATFIMLDRLDYLVPQMAEIQTPEGAPRLFDLVKPKRKEYLPAFYLAMRNTLVAKDLEQATRLAYGAGQRFRVVTLQGQLIEASGTMSGGGNKVAKGGMTSSLADALPEKQLQKMEAEVSGLSERLSVIKARKSELAKAVANCTKQFAKLEMAEKKVQMEVDTLQKQLTELRKRIPELTKSAANGPSDGDAKRISGLEKEMKAAAGTFEKAEKPAKKLEEEAAGLQKEISGAGGDRLKKQKKKFEGLSAELDEETSSATKCKVQHSTAKKNLAKAEKELAKATEQQVKVSAAAEEIRVEFKELEEQAFAVMEKYNETQALLDQKTAEVQGIQKEYDGLKEGVAKIRAAEVDLTNQLEDLAKTVKETAGQATSWDKKLAGVEKKCSQLLKETPEMAEEVKMDVLEEELGTYDREDVEREIARLEEAISSLKPNMGAIVEYREKEREYMERVAELDIITEQRDVARREYEDMRKKRLDEFMNGFNKITMKLKEMYQMITLGGDAELELVDTLDPFSEGIVFSVRRRRPPCPRPSLAAPSDQCPAESPPASAEP